VHDKLIVTVFAGPEFQDHHLSPDDPTAGLRGSYFGGRIEFDAWYEPTGLTLIAGDASISSIGLSYSVRIAAGLKLYGLFYVGPEGQTLPPTATTINTGPAFT
jgi:cellulose biosynthesis protein BcsS